jgi:SAM-dependent methyltransferase
MLMQLRARLGAMMAPRAVDSTAAFAPAPPDPLDDLIPDYAIASYVGGGGAEQYKQVGRMQADWLRDLGGLKPGDDVLEVGCGIGRIAAPLTQYLRDGSYWGFDVVPHGIEWCQQRIGRRYPNFNFFVADVYNRAYNLNGRQQASEYEFPFADGTFDFVFLTSVFTHMLADDVEHYAAEIGRVLRPGGRCYCTAYLVTSEARARMDAKESLRTFKPTADPRTWTDDPKVPEAAIGFADEYLFDVFARSGLDVKRVVPGEWWKNPYAQDTFVAHRR